MKESRPADVNLLVIAQCNSTLELVPSHLSTLSLLQELLPIYEERQHGKDSEVDDSKTKENIFESLPVPNRQAEEAWKTLCAFEIDGRSFQPGPVALLKVWKLMMTAIDIESLDVDQILPLRALSLTVDEDGLPLTLFEAVTARLGSIDRDESSSKKGNPS